MNKGLEALEKIKKGQYVDGRLPLINRVRIEKIEKELKDKEKFEELVNMDLDLFMKAVDIKGLIEDYQKFKKALEVIKIKEINVHGLLLHLKRFDEPDGYNVLVAEKYKLTQEEYNLLKEVLNYGDKN